MRHRQTLWHRPPQRIRNRQSTMRKRKRRTRTNPPLCLRKLRLHRLLHRRSPQKQQRLRQHRSRHRHRRRRRSYISRQCRRLYPYHGLSPGPWRYIHRPQWPATLINRTATRLIRTPPTTPMSGNIILTCPTRFLIIPLPSRLPLSIRPPPPTRPHRPSPLRRRHRQRLILQWSITATMIFPATRT